MLSVMNSTRFTKAFFFTLKNLIRFYGKCTWFH